MTALIDTSAWIEFLRPKGDPTIKSRVADCIARDAAAYTCPIRYELVLGARPQELDDLHQCLGFAKRIAVAPAHWDSAAGIAADLRLKGLSFPALDLLIATVACMEKLPLLARDAHFVAIREQALPKLKIL